jgi:hypothetical protein
MNNEDRLAMTREISDRRLEEQLEYARSIRKHSTEPSMIKLTLIGAAIGTIIPLIGITFGLIVVPYFLGICHK